MEVPVKEGETKPVVPAAEVKPPVVPAPAASNPPADDPAAKIARLEQELKERDQKLSDATTTLQTIQSREDQLRKQKEGTEKTNQLQERTKQILEKAAYDPDSSARELTELLSEVQSGASTDAVQKAIQTIQAKTDLDKIRTGVKSANLDFDEEITDLVMERANVLAASGKFKTADEAVKEATVYVKNKLDGYAAKKNQVPPLPAGALGEQGNNPAPKPQVQEKIETPEEYIAGLQDSKQKKIL